MLSRNQKEANVEHSTLNSAVGTHVRIPDLCHLSPSSSVEEERKTRVELYKFCSSWVRSRRKLVSELL